MDVHRCRFVPYPASAINSLAFSHPSSSSHSPQTLRLAVGRANGDVEIWNPLKGAWIQETILRGGKDRSIEGLVWTHDLPEHDSDQGKLRLFSIGCSTVVTEWDLALGKPLRHSGGNHGAIWCIAAQPRWQQLQNSEVSDPKRDQLIAVGCADGAVVLHSTSGEELSFSRMLARSSEKNSRVLCLAFRNRQQLVVGYANSTIKVFDIRSGAVLGAMSCNVGRAKGQPLEILVWSVKCLADGDVASGDSTGEIKIWDGKTWTMKQRIHSHLADVLDVITSSDGLRIMSGGMDRRTTLYQKGPNARWNAVSHGKFHTHDVKTLASYESRDLNIAVSGGPDGTPIVMPFRQFDREQPRALSAFTQSPPVLSAPPARLLLSWWEREICVWRLSKAHQEAEAPKRLIAKIMIQGDENLAAVSLSHRGNMIAAATMAAVKLFALQSVDDMTYKVRRVGAPVLAEAGAKLVQFSPDEKWLLVVHLDSSIRLHHIVRDGRNIAIGNPIELLQSPRPQKRGAKGCGSHGAYGQTVSRVAWSSDSRIIAVSDVDGFLSSWTTDDNPHHTQQLEASSDESDSGSQDESPRETDASMIDPRWTQNPCASIPRAPSMPLVLSFRPVRSANLGEEGSHSDEALLEDRLVVVTAQQELLEYRVTNGGLSDWSKRNPPSTLPSDFRILRDRAMGCLWDVHDRRERLWIYGLAWLWMLDLSIDYDGSEHSGRALAPTKFDHRLTKRKRPLTTIERTELMKHTSGAGNKKPDFELANGLGRKMRAWINDETQAEINLEHFSDGLDEVELKPAVDALTTLRRQRTDTNGLTAPPPNATVEPEPNVAIWSTFKYRPILGIATLDTHGEHAGLEVAIVERPAWDLNLPARWEDDHE